MLCDIIYRCTHYQCSQAFFKYNTTKLIWSIKWKQLCLKSSMAVVLNMNMLYIIYTKNFFRINISNNYSNNRGFTLYPSSYFFFLEKMLNVNLTFAIVLSAAIGGMVFSSGSITSSYAQNIVKRWSVDDPGGIVIDPKGNVYVAETGKNRILEFTSNGSLIRAWGSGGIGDGQFNSPLGITLDYARGYVYVTDRSEERRVGKECR